MGITKLDDANCAGTSRSRDCTLILTEGDSAKALAISGLGVVGRDYYGVFPLKGKLLNVREANHAQIMKNEEIQNIAKILGYVLPALPTSLAPCSRSCYDDLLFSRLSLLSLWGFFLRRLPPPTLPPSPSPSLPNSIFLTNA